LKEYKFSKKDFFWKWNEFFLENNKESTKIKFSILEDIELRKNTNFNVSASTYNNEILTDENLEYLNSKYLDLEILLNSDVDYYFPKKNQYGSMDFVIIGENNSKKPIAASPIKSSDVQQKNKVYRIVHNKNLEQDYWSYK